MKKYLAIAIFAFIPWWWLLPDSNQTPVVIDGKRPTYGHVTRQGRNLISQPYRLYTEDGKQYDGRLIPISQPSAIQPAHYSWSD